MKRPRVFELHGTERLHALEGLPLATFPQRALGYFIDVLVAVVFWGPAEFLWRHYVLHEENIEMRWDFHHASNIIVMVLYWALFNYFANGRTPGKFLARTQVMSLIGERMSFWQSVERALGYGAAVLEGGLGFVQFFWDKNGMCAQDRLAETIVVDVRKSTENRTRAQHTETATG